MQSDSAYSVQYSTMAHLLIEACEGNVAAIPQHYLDNFYHEFANGDISLVPALSKLDNAEDLEPWEFDEVLEFLHRVNPEGWPDVDSIESIDAFGLLEEDSESDLDFVEDNLGTAEKVERTLKSVIDSVFKDKVNSVRDRGGSYPSSANRFLQQDDGTFAGTFLHGAHKFLFEIAPREGGWICTYRMSESSLDSIPEIVKDVKRDDKEVSYNKSIRSKGWK